MGTDKPIPQVNVSKVTGDQTASAKQGTSERGQQDGFTEAIDNRIIKQNEGTVGFEQERASSVKGLTGDAVSRQRSILKKDKDAKEAAAIDLNSSKQVQFAEV